MSFVKHDLFHSEAMLTLIAVENVVRLLKKKTLTTELSNNYSYNKNTMHNIKTIVQ